jgi:hypothetical protein
MNFVNDRGQYLKSIQLDYSDNGFNDILKFLTKTPNLIKLVLSASEDKFGCKDPTTTFENLLKFDDLEILSAKYITDYQLNCLFGIENLRDLSIMYSYRLTMKRVGDFLTQQNKLNVLRLCTIPYIERMENVNFNLTQLVIDGDNVIGKSHYKNFLEFVSTQAQHLRELHIDQPICVFFNFGDDCVFDNGFLPIETIKNLKSLQKLTCTVDFAKFNGEVVSTSVVSLKLRDVDKHHLIKTFKAFPNLTTLHINGFNIDQQVTIHDFSEEFANIDVSETCNDDNDEIFYEFVTRFNPLTP